MVIRENAPAIKVQASREYGANVVFCAPTYEAREATVAAIQEETGAVFLHSHDQLQIISGQGTAAIELLERVEGLDLTVTPVGGGSRISGTAIATRPKFLAIWGLRPAANADDITTYGVEQVSVL